MNPPLVPRAASVSLKRSGLRIETEEKEIPVHWSFLPHLEHLVLQSGENTTAIRGWRRRALTAYAFPHESTPAECNDSNAGDLNKRTPLVPFELCKLGSSTKTSIVLNSEQLLLICY